MRHGIGAAGGAVTVIVVLLLGALFAAPVAAQDRRPSADRHEARRAALERQRRGALAPAAEATAASGDLSEGWPAFAIGRYFPPYGAFDSFYSPYVPPYGAPWADYPMWFDHTDGPRWSNGFGPRGWSWGWSGWRGYPDRNGWNDRRGWAGKGGWFGGPGVRDPWGRSGWHGWPDWHGRSAWHGWHDRRDWAGRSHWRGQWNWRDWSYARGRWDWARRMALESPWGWPWVPRHRFEDRYREDEGVAAGRPGVTSAARGTTAYPRVDGYGGGGAGYGAIRAAWSLAPVDAADCAEVRVKVVNGGVFRGWVSRLHYGTRDPRELELAIDAQLSSGRPVDLVTPDGYLVRVPPTVPVERIAVGACGVNP